MDIQKTYEEVYHSKTYSISINISQSHLSIFVQEDSSQYQWRGSFSAQFIEELCTKTGNYKKFSVFCKMMISGFEKSSQSIIIDVLTKEEFDQIRNEPKQSRDSKLLIIMTYVVEFDKVHYPLSLNLITSAHHKKSFNNYEAELNELRHIKQEKDIMESRLENMISERDKEIYYLSKEKEELQKELDKIKNQMDNIIEQLESQAKSNSSKSTKHGEEFKRQKEKLDAEVERLRSEVKEMREESKKDKSRIIQLETELKTLFEKSRATRSKSINSSSLQKSYSNYKENSEISHKISHLKNLLERAKD